MDLKSSTHIKENQGDAQILEMNPSPSQNPLSDLTREKLMDKAVSYKKKLEKDHRHDIITYSCSILEELLRRIKSRFKKKSTHSQESPFQ